MSYKRPPFNLTPLIFQKCQKIAFALGVLEGSKLDAFNITLRRANQVKSIQSSLAIEGNQLSIEQVTGLLEGKRVIGPQQDIIEVNNAIQIYSNLKKWDPCSIESLQAAHQLLMQNLIPNNGHWRTQGIGIFKGKKVAHVAPPASRVPLLMGNLFFFLNNEIDIPWLIKACVFHYELEFIHPFSDGNGRIGRLWQQILLMKEHRIFQYISVESIIKDKQANYYNVLAQSDSTGDATLFLEFSLEQILCTLNDYLEQPLLNKKMDNEIRLQYVESSLKNKWFTRKDYLFLHKTIAPATASRDLERGVKLKILIKRGDKKITEYRFQ